MKDSSETLFNAFHCIKQLTCVIIRYRKTYNLLRETARDNLLEGNKKTYEKVAARRHSDLGDGFNAAAVPAYDIARVVL